MKTQSFPLQTLQCITQLFSLPAWVFILNITYCPIWNWDHCGLPTPSVLVQEDRQSSVKSCRPLWLIYSGIVVLDPSSSRVFYLLQHKWSFNMILSLLRCLEKVNTLKIQKFEYIKWKLQKHFSKCSKFFSCLYLKIGRTCEAACSARRHCSQTS